MQIEQNKIMLATVRGAVALFRKTQDAAPWVISDIDRYRAEQKNGTSGAFQEIRSMTQNPIMSTHQGGNALWRMNLSTSTHLLTATQSS